MLQGIIDIYAWLSWKFEQAIEFIKKLPSIIMNWFLETYEWVTEAFTNWDLELDNFREQVVQLGYQLVDFFYLIIYKGKEFIKELYSMIAEMLHEFLKAFDSWR